MPRLKVTASEWDTREERVSFETIAKLIPIPEEPVVFHGVNFKINKSRLTVKADPILDLAATSLKRKPHVKV